MPSRRDFIKTGIVGTALLAAGGGALRFFGGRYALWPGELAIGLGEKELCVARALVEALVPGGGELPAGVDLGIQQRIDEQAWSADPHTRREFVDALNLIEHAPPLFGYFGRFTALSPSERADVFERMLTSRRDLFAQIAFSFKQMVQLLYYADERVWPAIGYDGPWIKEARPPASAIAYAKLVAERKGRLA